MFNDDSDDDTGVDDPIGYTQEGIGGRDAFDGGDMQDPTPVQTFSVAMRRTRTGTPMMVITEVITISAGIVRMGLWVRMRIITSTAVHLDPGKEHSSLLTLRED